MKQFRGEHYLKKSDQTIILPEVIVRVIGRNASPYRIITAGHFERAVVTKVPDAIDYYRNHFQAPAKPIILRSDNRLKIDVNIAFAKASMLVLHGLGDHFKIMTEAEFDRSENRSKERLRPYIKRNPDFDASFFLDI